MSVASGSLDEIGSELPRAPQRIKYRAFRSISALMLREVATRFGRTPGGFIWAVLQPLATIIVLGFAFSLIARTPSLGTSFIMFKATGMLPFSMFKTTSNMVGKSLSFSKQLLAYPGVNWIDAVLARLFLNVAVSLVVTILILAGIIYFEGLTLILDWPRIAMATLLAALLGFGIGMLNCFLVERISIWSNVWGIMTAPLMIASGVLMLYDDLPPLGQKFLWYNPVMHITGLMREGFYSTYQPSYISIPYVLACSLIPLCLGLLLVRRYHLELLNR